MGIRSFLFVCISLFAFLAVGYAVEITTKRCEIFDKGAHLVVSAGCSRADLPQLDANRLMDEVLPLVEGIGGLYQADALVFTASHVSLDIGQTVWDAWRFYRDSVAQHRHGVFTLPLRVLALDQLDERTVYGAWRDTTPYGTCKKHNYTLAMRALDRDTIDPGELLNLNRDLTLWRGRCQNPGENFGFGEGACGASTQLFRNALMDPRIEVTKRYPHGEWYAGFYGPVVLGDDASMYMWNKQFEIKNKSTTPVTFRTRNRDDGNQVLLSMSRENPEATNIITKQQTGPRSAELTVQTVSHAGEVVYEKTRVSYYRGINEERD